VLVAESPSYEYITAVI